MHDLVRRARDYATQAHERIDQRRKYSGQPYDVHLRGVAELVAQVTDDPETVAAAWLHDVVEDTPATFEDVEREFGPAVGALVAEVTDVSKASDGNRAERKALDRAHLARASARAQTVKLADLIDNCQDICRHDTRFGRTYLVEMAATLGVLRAGDAKLRRRAEETLALWGKQLGVAVAVAPEPLDEEASPQPITTPARHRAARLFMTAFVAEDVAEPLRSFDADQEPEAVASALRSAGVDVVGVRQDGEIRRYARLADLRGARLDGCSRAFAPGQLLDGEASLSAVIRALNHHEHCFVALLGGVAGVIGRPEVQKPIVRMWLFGVITFFEMDLTARIKATWTGEEWAASVPETRLEKARALHAERQRRGQPCELVDCLQLSDKGQVLLESPEFLARMGFASKKAAKRVLQDVESLRNNLAHAQDIVTHDWAQIARLAERVQEQARAARGGGED